MTHKIKLNINLCDAVLSGDKNFEVRLNDRGYQKGDLIQFVPWKGLSAGYSVPHELAHKTYAITYVLNGYSGIEDDYCVFGIKEVTDDGRRED